MVSFEVLIKRFDKQGEKTGWTYLEIPAAFAQQLKPANKKSFRVKGRLDGVAIKAVALIPMGGGDFIMPLNGAMRRAIRKGNGDWLKVQLEIDPDAPKVSAELIACLEDEPAAKEYFSALPPSHQLYYTRWIESAKTDTTRTRRIAQAINAMARQMDFGQMLRQGKEQL